MLYIMQRWNVNETSGIIVLAVYSHMEDSNKREGREFDLALNSL
jgi:hypothetical protein